MFAICFDLQVSMLKKHYGEPYNNAYYEVSNVMEEHDFYRIQGSVYLTQEESMAGLMRCLNALKSIEWFRRSLRDIRAFRVENWSDFTSFVKEE